MGHMIALKIGRERRAIIGRGLRGGFGSPLKI
jgi:hypothetical protein